MVRVRYWSMDRIALMIVQMILNKFDCFIIIEGNRGLGKSTLAWKIVKKVHNYLRIIVRETGGLSSPYSKFYEFKPIMQLRNPMKHKYLLYKKDDVINFFNKWHVSAIADEMINVAFNREFWDEDQKNLIKIINMNRDHCNLFVACVPQFQVLDNQIKNLCKIRITVARRGLAVIQTPNRTIYNRDRWDSANNEKIEREWLKKGTGLPQYAKLNTFRGLLKFKALSDNEQRIYDDIKLSERNIIAKSLGVTDQIDEKDPMNIAIERLIDGGVKNMQVIEGLAIASGEKVDNFKAKIRRKLSELNKNPQISSYFWDNKAKKEGDDGFVSIE